MDSSKKLYNLHGFDSKKLLEIYFGGGKTMRFVEDTLKFPIDKIDKAVKSEFPEGDPGERIMIDLSLGPMLHHLFSICHYFKEITLLRFRDRCIMELRKWLDDHTQAFDWSHIFPILLCLEGHEGDWQAKTETMKSTIKQVVKCNAENETLTYPVVLPQADCVISAWILDITSTNEDEYMTTLRKILSFVKPGGLLLLVGVVNGSFFTVGEDSMHVFTHDENFVKNALTREGCTVIHCEVKHRTVASDLTDYKGKSFIAARKNK